MWHAKGNAWLPVVLALSAALSLNAQTAQAAEFKVGQKFPRFTLRTIDGKVVSSSVMKNKPFWMTFFHSG
jgi:hypothetical protein